MKSLGLGTNLEPRRFNLTRALAELAKICEIKKVSPVYETPALLKEGSPDQWNLPFLNLVIEFDSESKPQGFLKALKKIEIEMGRGVHEEWAPRNIDLDILFWDDQVFKSLDLEIPHPEMEKRSFVLDPLKDLSPQWAEKARALRSHTPLWMGILNATPDSFSVGGHLALKEFGKKLSLWEEHGVHIYDLGAESTRPGAQTITLEEEWKRLKPYLEVMRERHLGTSLKPLISLDTRNSKTAEKAIEWGVDIINDVSGLENPEMLSLLKNSEVSYVLMHNCGVPADPKKLISGDPIVELSSWLEEKINALEKSNISLNRVYFDPGIGFGKNTIQSQQILKNFEAFQRFPLRTLVGHSRKSLFKYCSPGKAQERDFETLGASMNLIQKSVDVLRVHDPVMHIKALRGWLHVT
jgi:dihydropteroate synthase/2-amino-4-hydroxy-6-hydroxymethyldihydropteridine diphosphokinase